MKYISNINTIDTNITDDSFIYHLHGTIYIKLANNLTDDEFMLAKQRWNNFCLNEDIINKFLIEHNRTDPVAKPTLNIGLQLSENIIIVFIL
jgi:hypothetical protein